MAQFSSRVKIDQHAARAQVQMLRDGCRWIDHFENHAVHGKPPTTRSPGYVFSRTGDLFVALTESKATKGASRSAFTKTVRDGLATKNKSSLICAKAPARSLSGKPLVQPTAVATTPIFDQEESLAAELVSTEEIRKFVSE